ncbi:MAG: T9SS type A sorting domain-containing protein [Reichenbachiella sp.]
MMKTLTLKHFLGSMVLLILMQFSLKAQPTPPSGKQWQAVSALSDEFNGFDGNKWQRGHPYWAGRSPSQFNNNNVTYGGGTMRITATLKNANRTGDWLWTGCLTSKAKTFKKGMYAEVRMKAADLAIVSSFWMQGSYSEIDVIENWGEVKNSNFYLDYTMMSNTHYFADGWANDKITPKHFTNPGNAKNSEAYHTFGVWWKDAWTINYYRDGSYVGSATPGGAFNEDMYMFFDMEAFSWGPGLPSNADLGNWTKSTAFYDYVRTYELVNSSGGGGTGQLVALKNQGNNQYVCSENGVGAMNCNRSGIGAWEKFQWVDLGGGQIALKGNNGKYVSSENGTKKMTCNRSSIGAWEKFSIGHVGNQVYWLKGNNGKYISSDMWCTATGVGNNQKFAVTWGLNARKLEGAGSSLLSDVEEQISVYPNPANNNINFTGLTEGDHLSVFNIQGKLMIDKLVDNPQVNLAIEQLEKGIYFVQVKNGQSNRTLKFLKK